MQKERIRNGGVRVRSLAAGLAASFAVAGLVAVMQIRGMNQAPAAAATAADSASSSKGTFENVCAACHGIDGHGGERGPDIASRAETLQKTDSELLVILKEGRTAKGMPGFAAYGEDRLKALVGYLRVLQGRTKEASPGDAVAGKA